MVVTGLADGVVINFTMPTSGTLYLAAEELRVSLISQMLRLSP